MQKKLIILRGLPFCGKSYTAKELASKNTDAIILSTDEYWYKINKPDKPEEYSFSPRFLGDAHNWNQQRAHRLIEQGSPYLIIDNTNTTAKEFCCDYLRYAHFQDYEIEIREPSSPQWLEIEKLLYNKRDNKKALKDWSHKLAEGSKGIHDVPFFAIERMIWRWEVDLTPEKVLADCLNSHN